MGTISILQVFLFGCFLQQVQPARVRFFAGANYANFVWEKQLDGIANTDCVNLPDYAKDRDYQSIKTRKCVVLFNQPDCKKPMHYKTQLRVQILSKDEPNFSQKVSSFHLCNEDMGATNGVKVDIYKRNGELLQDAQYTNVCNCRNLPESRFSGKKKIPWSLTMDNHGNCVNIYCEENCQGKSNQIPAGFTKESDSLHIWNSDGSSACRGAVSFQPCNAKECAKLHASIYKMEFRNGSGVESLSTTDLLLASDTEYNNPTPVSASKTIKVDQDVKEEVEYSVSSNVSTVSSFDVEAGVEFEAEVGVPLVKEATVKSHVTTTYHREKSTQDTTSKATRVQVTRKIQNTFQFNIPPCVEGTARVVMKMVKDFPIEYTAYARISGSNGDEQMSVEEVRQKIDTTQGIEYVGGYNGTAVLAKFVGEMKATYGMRTKIGLTGKKIKSCVNENPKLNLVADDKESTDEVDAFETAVNNVE